VSTPRNAKTAALEALIEAHAVELKLPTVRRRFREFAADAVREQQTPIAYLAALLDAEHQERAERRERRRLIDARFPIIKHLEDFRFVTAPTSRKPRSPHSPKVPGSTTANKIDALDLRGAVLIGFSTGGGEVARYIGRHGTDRVAGAVLVSAVPPLMLKTDDNPGGVPLEVFDEIRAGSIADRSQLYRDLADGPFFGNNRPGANVSQGMRDSFWRQGMQSGHRNAYECIAAFSATDFRGDLERFDVPTLVIHGDDDQVVPIDVGGRASAALVDGRSSRSTTAVRTASPTRTRSS
jgi:hypothetical protein